MIIKNGFVFLEDNQFHDTNIYMKDNAFTKDSPDDDVVFDASGCYVIPGLTDIHFHGCAGHDFCDGNIEDIKAIATYQLAHGVTTICPATMTLPIPELLSICNIASEFSAKNFPKMSRLLGIDLEGPFISFEKKGAQNPQYIRNASKDTLLALQKSANGLIKIVAIAPEEPDAIETIKELHTQFKFSIAHTMADYKTSMQAFLAGASHVTHLYNAMPAFSHRAPGVIGAAFDTPNAEVELICDGIHVDPSVVRATFQLFSDDRVILISDSMRATGMPDGTYSLGGQMTTLKGHQVTLSDNTLAGSATNLMDCMKMAVSMGIPLESAVKAAAVNSAKSIGVYDTYGSITPGKIANLVFLDPADLSIRHIIFEGEFVSFDVSD